MSDVVKFSPGALSHSGTTLLPPAILWTNALDAPKSHVSLAAYLPYQLEVRPYTTRAERLARQVKVTHLLPLRIVAAVYDQRDLATNFEFRSLRRALRQRRTPQRQVNGDGRGLGAPIIAALRPLPHFVDKATDDF
jgi:hypothetical protein